MKTLLSVFFVTLFASSYAQCVDEVKAIWSRNDTAFVGSNDSLFRTFDGGVSWVIMNLPESTVKLSTREIEVLNGKVYVATNNGDNRMFQSSDWGSSWTTVKNGIENIFGYSALIPRIGGVSATHVFIGGNNDIKRFDEGAKEWKVVLSGFGDAFVDLGNDTLVASTGLSASKTSYSVDGGVTWTPLASEPTINVPGSNPIAMVVKDIAQINGDLIVVGNINGSALHKSSDFGVSWQAVGGVSGVNTENGKKFLKLDDNTLLYAGQGSVWKSNDGVNWTELLKVNGAIRTMRKWKTDKLLLGATSGLYEATNLGEDGATVSICRLSGNTGANSVKKNVVDVPFLLSPNPALDFVKVTCEGEYRIYDEMGKVVLVSNAKTLSLSTFKSGIYVFQDGNGNVERLLVK